MLLCRTEWNMSVLTGDVEAAVGLNYCDQTESG
jgi:hypothetical protein